MRKLLAILTLAFSTAAIAQTPPQIGDQVLSNSAFTESTPVYSGTVLLYSKPLAWSCPTYRNSPYGSYCDYREGNLVLIPYRTSNRIQPSGYWYQRVYLQAGTYDVDAVFNVSGPKGGSQGVSITVGSGGPSAANPEALRYMSNEAPGVKSSVWRVQTSGYYYVTISALGTRQLLNSGMLSTLFIDSLSFTYSGY